MTLVLKGIFTVISCSEEDAWFLSAYTFEHVATPS